MSSAFVVSTLVGVTVAMGLGLAAATLARKGRAASRHVLLMASLGVSLLLPVFSAVMPPVQIAVPIASAVEPVGSAPADVGGLEMNVASTIAEPQAQPQASSRFSWPSMSAVALGLWLAVAFVVVAPVFAGLRQMRWLRRTALPWHRGQSIADDRARAVNIRRRVAVLLHEVVAGPVTCGVHHAVILLPLDAESWSRADLDRALVHELEHVRRHDWLTQCVARTLCACYWFHPLVWITRRQIALEAERACDDAVLTMAEGAGATEATAYADQLVGLAKRLSAAAHQPLLAMADRRDLSTRVRALLDANQPRGRAGTLLLTAVAAVSLGLVITLSPLRVVVEASDGLQIDVGKPAPGAVALQSPANQKFDAVSVKPCENEAPTPPGQRSSQGGFPTTSPGRFVIECGTVERLISVAYVRFGETLTNQDARIGDISWMKNAPSWVRSDKFTIEAKAAGTPDDSVMRGPMLRALLEDRFKLQVHRATEDAPMYALTVAKGGLKIKPMAPDGCVVYDANNPPDPRGALQGGKPICGGMTMAGGAGRMVWTIGGDTMNEFAHMLSAWMDRHVIDRTGVTDTFNIRLEYAPDEHTPGPDKRGPARTDFPEPNAPSIFQALEQQLGLKLEPTKGPQMAIVIDHVERPTPNSPAVAEALAGKPPARAMGPGR